jgi:hypothetical protein
MRPGRGRRVDVRVVIERKPTQEQKVMECADHGAEGHCAESGDDADRQHAEDHDPP